MSVFLLQQPKLGAVIKTLQRLELVYRPQDRVVAPECLHFIHQYKPFISTSLELFLSGLHNLLFEC